VHQLTQFGTSGGGGRRFIIGPTGVGKTATVLRVLRQQFGVFVDVSPERDSAVAVGLHDRLVSGRIGCSVEDAELAFCSVHSTMLLVLEAFMNASPAPTAEQWMYLQLAASNADYARPFSKINSVLGYVFHEAKRLALTSCRILVEDLKKKLQCPLLFVDEAQRLLGPEYGKDFRPIANARPVLSVLVARTRGLVLCGTGLRMRDMQEIASSGAGTNDDDFESDGESESDEREDSMIILQHTTAENVQTFLSAYGVPVPLGCDDKVGQLAGRARAAANLVSRCLRRSAVIVARSGSSSKEIRDDSGDDIGEGSGDRSGERSGDSSGSDSRDGSGQSSGGVAVAAMASSAPSNVEASSAVTQFTKSVDMVLNGMANDICSIMTKRLAEVIDTAPADQADLKRTTYAEIAKQLIIGLILYGGALPSNMSPEMVDFVDAGMCSLTRSDVAAAAPVQAHLREEVGIRALWKLAQANNWNPAFDVVVEHMKNPLTSASNRGDDMELVFVLDVAMNAISPAAREGVAKLVFGDLLVSAWPSYESARCTIVDGRGRPEELASTDVEDLMTLEDFLQMAKAGDYDSRRGPVFFLPDKFAGPDVVTLLDLKDENGGNAGQALWLVQVKRKKKTLSGVDADQAIATVRRSNLYSKKGKCSARFFDKQRKVRALCEQFALCIGTVCTSTGFAGTKLADAEATTTPTDHIRALSDAELKQLMSRRGYEVATRANAKADNSGGGAKKRIKRGGANV
jgi:hypothetical protein